MLKRNKNIFLFSWARQGLTLVPTRIDLGPDKD